MNSLREMNQRRQEWLNSKPAFDGGMELRLQQDDQVYFHFVASGEDGDQFIKVYRAHIVDAISRNGKRYSETRYCPRENGDNEDCPLCAQGHTDIKERMSIYMYVYNILHKTLPNPPPPADKPFPIVTDGGSQWFNEEVVGFKIWHTSAWKESPWVDINNLGEIYKGLHNFLAKMQVLNGGIDRRFKVYAIPNSAFLAPEVYERAKAELTSVPDILKSQVSSPVQMNPAAATAGSLVAAAPVQAFSVPGAPIAAFSLGQTAASPVEQEIVVQPEANPDRPMQDLFPTTVPVSKPDTVSATPITPAPINPSKGLF